VNTKVTSIYLFDVLGITKHADPHLWARDVRQLNRTTETLVLLWVIVLQTNLQLNGFDEFAVLLTTVIGNACDCLPQGVALQLAEIHRNQQLIG
jgi:hypothetical protein